MEPDEPVKAIVVGAGDRGRGYASYALAHPNELEIVAVVDPRAAWRDSLAERHGLAPERCFESVEELVAGGLLDAVVINASPDRAHLPTTEALLEAGYKTFLLEKPAGASLDELGRLAKLVAEYGAQVEVCHVLRFTKFFRAIRDVVCSGELGDIITVRHEENVAQLHFSHSYVRGNWRNSESSSPFVLAKTCHDLDILTWILDDRFSTVSSIGGLNHFRPENAPPGSLERCSEACAVAAECPFYAPSLYVNELAVWPATTVTLENTIDARVQALAESPYGRCVYHCDNNVPDNQMVQLETTRGISVSMNVHGHSTREGRRIEVVGTKATLAGSFVTGNSTCTVTTVAGVSRSVDVDTHSVGDGGHAHGGGDSGLVAAFVKHVRTGDWSNAATLSTAVSSHLAAFGAEESRSLAKVVRLDELWQRVTDV